MMTYQDLQQGPDQLLFTLKIIHLDDYAKLMTAAGQAGDGNDETGAANGTR
ncbi:hypothetical protein GCM10011338_00770 [Alteromonas lipolytica]|nr:hypothetical protein GCM10011338_00770 [Alteromonas lipolytica]